MNPVASVIVPTFGDAVFLEYSLKSIRRQTVPDIEILVLCDNASPNVLGMLQGMSAEDPRIRYFAYEKGRNRGAERRGEMIRRSASENIFYCCHGDMWFQNHIETLLPVLETAPLAHTIQMDRNTPEGLLAGGPDLAYFLHYDLQNPDMRRLMLEGFHGAPYNFFGITVTAHTKSAYLGLAEGWVNDSGDVFGDLYVWRQFLARYGDACKSVPLVTTIKFSTTLRCGMTAAQRREEMARYYADLDTPAFKEAMQGWILDYICQENTASMLRQESIVTYQKQVSMLAEQLKSPPLRRWLSRITPLRKMVHAYRRMKRKAE